MKPERPRTRVDVDRRQQSPQCRPASLRTAARPGNPRDATRNVDSRRTHAPLPPSPSRPASLTAPCSSIRIWAHRADSDFGLVRIGDHGAFHVSRTARDVGQPRGHQPSGARFRKCDAISAGSQHLADHRLHRPAVSAEDVLTEHGASPAERPRRATTWRRQWTTTSSTRCSSIWPSAARIVALIARRRLLPFPIQRLQDLVGLRLDAPGDLQHAANERRPGGTRAQAVRRRASRTSAEAPAAGQAAEGRPIRLPRATAPARCHVSSR